jgi:hypothetical protein
MPREITRRTFLKGGAAACALATAPIPLASPYSFFSSPSFLRPLQKEVDKGRALEVKRKTDENDRLPAVDYRPVDFPPGLLVP